MKYKDQSDQPLDGAGRLGVLLVNLGTPDAPTTASVRRYLAEFLSDPRVVELPRLLWMLILHGIILRTRPKHSAAAYRGVWGEQGSPLMEISRQQESALRSRLQQRLNGQVELELAMRYGNPSIASALERLRKKNLQRLLVLPLYPQYSATTTASTFDAVTSELQHWRRLPELRFINRYWNQADYIQLLADNIRHFRQAKGEPQRLLFSFHGIPQSYADQGDPYPSECLQTARRTAEALGLDEDEWALSFQSRFGRQEWIKPYTDVTLKAWGTERLQRVHVVSPGFSADCLETLEELGEENRHYFQQAGGGEYAYIPALNEHPDHIGMLANLVCRHLRGWPEAEQNRGEKD
ncbi:ferrochelatase [endosymbiont of Riftia pachyptila]|uniref:Ferrochelatase n=1 Tax=endosymbiont of Riftia pachyptila (vent Ph05) TaxID=1048808 RepID=G2DB11_9GAMM|nr:ferrochelatase [endosymbiont of Riftia pachyptila]EGV52212.1 ferrochelatase, protoheme ferro-lyase [endosymbiont of Riftia pachyptila (vent Ph05)]